MILHVKKNTLTIRNLQGRELNAANKLEWDGKGKEIFEPKN